MMMKNSEKVKYWGEKNLLAVIFLLALFLRLIAIISLPAQFHAILADAAEYDKIATNLLAGKGFTLDAQSAKPTTFRLPLYPMFLASIYFLFGHSYFAVRVIQAILGALLCVIIFYIARKIFNQKIALLSAFIMAIYQPAIFSVYFGGPAFLLSENLFNFLLSILILFLVNNLFLSFRLKDCFISGLILGLLVLTRPIFALFPLFFGCLVLYVNRPRFILAIKKSLVILIGFILVILPWAIRNYFVYHAFMPLSTQGGMNLLLGNNAYVRGGGFSEGGLESLVREEDRALLGKMSEVQKDKLYRKYVKEFFLKNYPRLPKIFLKKLLVQWDPFLTDYFSPRRERKYNPWYAIVLIFSLFGMVKAIKSKLNPRTALLFLLFLYTSVIAMVFAGDPRFRYPVEPYLVIFASAGIFTIYDYFRNKLYFYLVTGSVIGINLFFNAYPDWLLGFARQYLRRLL